MKGNIKIFREKIWTELVNLQYEYTQGYSDDYTMVELCRNLLDNKTAIVSAFPGTGKTYVFDKIKNLKILDSDSSTFDKSNFPENYIKHIKDNIGKVDIIFVSSHKEVRDALTKSEIEYILVYPKKSLKEEYIERYKNRGSNEKFIELIENNWELWIKEMKNQNGCFKYELKEYEFLNDFMAHDENF